MTTQERTRAVRWLAFVAAAGFVACASPARDAVSDPSRSLTAADACRATAGAGAWAVAVEIDGPDRATIALTRGAQIALCSSSRTVDGPGSTDVGIGTHPIAAPPTLTYSSSSGTSTGTPSDLVGRVPAGTDTVRLAFADGSDQPATVANGIWLATLDRPATPIRIEARDRAGMIVGAIEDANGLQPSD